MGRVKYIVLLAALAAVFSLAHIDLNGLRFATAERLALSSNLEDISRLEADMIKFLDTATRFAEGSNTVSKEQVAQAFAVAKSRVEAVQTLAYSPALDSFNVERAAIATLAAQLHEAGLAVQTLSPGNQTGLRLIRERIEPMLPTADRLADVASEVRKSRSIELLEAQKEAADSVSRLQLQCAMIGIIAMFLLARDLTQARNLNLELRLREERIRDLATRDSLTGLYNRRHFDERVKSLKSANGQEWYLYLIDLDGFKAINDNHGHIAGDHVLGEVARRIDHIAGSAALTARLGGDEFAIIATLDHAKAEKLARALLKKIAEPSRYNGRPLVISASIGIAATCQTDQCPEAKDIFQRADQALYVAKYNGKNNYQFCNAPNIREGLKDVTADAPETLPQYPNVIDIATRFRRMISISYSGM
jgi:diguanylate cyclase (GGDEF)-like protein